VHRRTLTCARLGVKRDRREISNFTINSRKSSIKGLGVTGGANTCIEPSPILKWNGT